MTKLTDEEIQTQWKMLDPLVRGHLSRFVREIAEERGVPISDIKREAVEELMEDQPYLFDKTNLPRVYMSRHSAELKPGMGESIDWKKNEIVEIIKGRDKGRLFKIKSESMVHDDCPGEYVREGKFLDGRNGRVAKREKQMWFPNVN